VAQRDLLKRYLDAGMAFTAMTRTRAEGIVKELVRAGEVQREQVQSQVDDLVHRSRHNTGQLQKLMRKEIAAQLSQLGLATKDDLKALERRLNDRFGTPAKRAAGRKAAGPKGPAHPAGPAHAAGPADPTAPAARTAPVDPAARVDPAKKG
jgi:polyhydroxyalkanoate synthesis regulator phasin